MNDRIALLRQQFITDKIQIPWRQQPEDNDALAGTFSRDNLSHTRREALRLIHMLSKETPVVFANERIAFTRTVPAVPALLTAREMAELKATHFVHGEVSNLSLDYTRLIRTGLRPKIASLEVLKAQFQQHNQSEQAGYTQLQIEILESILDLSERYRETAQLQGNKVVARTLSRVPANPPENFLEALQMFRILHFTAWCGGHWHNTIGRLDQYLYPWLEHDLQTGALNEESALELLEEFFLTFNRDADIYPGVQQGDNGQTLMLGGLNPDGTDSYNLLSALCLKASLNLNVIDPKINLRVHSKTPIETYILATRLTKQGLGFPQYANDDVVIPGLMALGYSKADAYNYVVAACWEFIIPGRAMDIPNINGLSFAEAVLDTVGKKLAACASYSELFTHVKSTIASRIDTICQQIKNLYLFPAPYFSLMMEGCTETARDISLGCIYNNYGLHGTGLSTAADSLAAIKKFIFDEQIITAEEMLAALKNDFVGYEDLANQLRYLTPKMGQNDDYVDSIAVDLLNCFADELQGRKNERGGIFRSGTGSAMYYIWHSSDLPATPDGRYRGEGIGCNYSPGLFTKCAGPVSIIKSFTRPDLKRTINGGPLTLELHDTLFRTADSIAKVALMVKSFIEAGGHQIQLNAVNRETLINAQKHPENYRNLIVRVWGWSGYFVELDKVYQDHVIQRMELVI
ncbi:pyruvate formate lyase family protein [Superficieibacter sp.]|uniref:pyruvate formate lyase family protein n=1 Tax=Superficieibacter sp. TaxID=2303322 RepID=UPI0028A86F1B|nr:pyruvate formate lyase family protein [Superficieibacter sp.]